MPATTIRLATVATRYKSVPGLGASEVPALPDPQLEQRRQHHPPLPIPRRGFALLQGVRPLQQALLRVQVHGAKLGPVATHCGTIHSLPYRIENPPVCNQRPSRQSAFRTLRATLLTGQVREPASNELENLPWQSVSAVAGLVSGPADWTHAVPAVVGAVGFGEVGVAEQSQQQQGQQPVKAVPTQMVKLQTVHLPKSPLVGTLPHRGQLR